MLRRLSHWYMSTVYSLLTPWRPPGGPWPWWCHHSPRQRAVGTSVTWAAWDLEPWRLACGLSQCLSVSALLSSLAGGQGWLDWLQCTPPHSPGQHGRVITETISYKVSCYQSQSHHHNSVLSQASGHSAVLLSHLVNIHSSRCVVQVPFLQIFNIPTIKQTCTTTYQLFLFITIVWIINTWL